jgi:hypothetical protein
MTERITFLKTFSSSFCLNLSLAQTLRLYFPKIKSTVEFCLFICFFLFVCWCRKFSSSLMRELLFVEFLCFTDWNSILNAKQVKWWNVMNHHALYSLENFYKKQLKNHFWKIYRVILCNVLKISDAHLHVYTCLCVQKCC